MVRPRTYARACYEVEVVEQAELLQPPRPGMLPGPYTAETLPVSVEGAYLTVEIPSG